MEGQKALRIQQNILICDMLLLYFRGVNCKKYQKIDANRSKDSSHLA